MAAKFEDDEIPMLVPSESRSIPVTIITGYLGAGKSTLLKHILFEQAEKKIAVLMNEIAKGLNLEEKIILSETGRTVEEWVELPNGCLCCSAKDNGVKAIEKLLKKKRVIDYIIVETTGLADPGPVASVFWMDKELGSNIFLDGIVTVVDGSFGLLELQQYSDPHTRERRSSVNEWVRQVALADVIILNKMDLTSEDKKSTMINGIKHINGIADIIEATKCKIDISRILDLDMYSNDSNKLISKIAKQYEEAPPSIQHLQQKRVSTYCLRTSNVLHRSTYDRFFQALLWHKSTKAEIFRVKGLVFVSDTHLPLVVNGVYDTYEMEAMDVEAMDHVSTLIFIGVDIDEEVKHWIDLYFLSEITEPEEPLMN